MSDLVFDPAAWAQAAAGADWAADGVDTAAQAVGQALPTGAFGLMCSPLFLPPYELVAGIEGSVLSSAANAVRAAAANLRTAAGVVSEAESSVTAAMNQMVPQP